MELEGSAGLEGSTELEGSMELEGSTEPEGSMELDGDAPGSDCCIIFMISNFLLGRGIDGARN